MNIYLMFLLLFLTVAVAICAGLLVFDYWKGHAGTIAALKVLVEECDGRTKSFKDQVQNLRSLFTSTLNEYDKKLEQAEARSKEAFLAFSEKIDELEEANKEWAQTFSDELHRLDIKTGNNSTLLEGFNNITDALDKRLYNLKSDLNVLEDRHNDMAEDFINTIKNPKQIELTTAKPLKFEMVPHVVNKLAKPKRKVKTK